MLKGKRLARVVEQFEGHRMFWAIMFVIASIAAACQIHFKRRFAEKLRQDYAEYDSTLDLSIPFVVKHGVQFSMLDRSDVTYVYIFGYRRVLEDSLTLADPIIPAPSP